MAWVLSEASRSMGQNIAQVDAEPCVEDEGEEEHDQAVAHVIVEMCLSDGVHGQAKFAPFKLSHRDEASLDGDAGHQGSQQLVVLSEERVLDNGFDEARSKEEQASEDRG